MERADFGFGKARQCNARQGKARQGKAPWNLYLHDDLNTQTRAQDAGAKGKYKGQGARGKG
jgi:hypothetical protein